VKAFEIEFAKGQEKHQTVGHMAHGGPLTLKVAVRNAREAGKRYDGMASSVSLKVGHWELA